MNRFTALAAALLFLPLGAAFTAPAAAEEAAYRPLEDLRSFYKFIPLPQPAERTRAVGNGAASLVFGPDARDLRINGTRCILSHPVKNEVTERDLQVSETDWVKLIDPVLRPTYIANRRLVKTVVLDPGHGGHDAGAATQQVREADVTLIVATKLAEELRKRGFHVVLTHEQNQYMSDQQRVDSTETALNAVFISLHLNSGRSDRSGVETYTVSPAAPGERGIPGNEHDAANAALALALQSSVVQSCGAKDGACRRARYSLLSSLKCPAALVALGYTTNEQEGALLATDAYQTRLAMALADGVSRFAALMNPETILQNTAAPAPAEPEPAQPVKVEAGKVQPPAPAETTNKRGKRGSGTTDKKKAAGSRTPARRK